MNYNLGGWKIEEREGRADDACSARKCRETGKKDEEGGVDLTQFVGNHKGFLFRA